jgi:hypothetical protein
MNTPPIQQPKQKNHVKTAIRMPAALHHELSAAAEQNGHSLNAEMLYRLSSSPLDDIKRQNEELKMMLRQVLGHLRS